MTSELEGEAREALLVAIKEQVEAIRTSKSGTTSAAEGLKHLTEAYALLERPIIPDTGHWHEAHPHHGQRGARRPYRMRVTVSSV